MFALLTEEPNGEARPNRLRIMITTIGERNFDFYDKRGYKEDYAMSYEAGWMGSTKGEHLAVVSSEVIVSQTPD